MQTYVSYRIVVAAALALAPLVCAGQKFQEPTKEELQMTSDPKAPGAPAVFLYREKTTDNYNHYISLHARIKVLTELGKEWATVEVPYSGTGRPPSIEGRTIHADGTVIPLTGSGADLLVEKNFRGHMNARVFTLPSVEVGSILEYRWTLPISDSSVTGITDDMRGFVDSALAGSIPYWDVQQDLFIHKERFYYNPLGDLERNVIGNQSIVHFNSNGEVANYLLYSARLPAGAHVDVSPKQDYTLVAEDIPAFLSEAYAPPEESRRYGVRFYYSPYLNGDTFWNNEGKRWSKEIEQFSEATPDLKAAAAQITTGAATDEEKARKIYDAVQALDNTAYSHERSEAERAQQGFRRQVKSAQQVWAEKSGNPREIASLYLALVRAAGLQADAMGVADRSRRIFDPGYLALDQLAGRLVVLHLGGNDVFTDPGEKLLPFGQLHWTHTLSGGLLQTASGVSRDAVTPPNNPKDAITGNTAVLTLDAQGGVTGTVKLLMNGPEALRWRQLNLTAGTAEVQTELNIALSKLLPQGIGAEITGIKGLDTSAGFVEVSAQVNGKLGTATGKRLLVPEFFFETRPHVEFVQENERVAPVDLHYAEQVIDDVVYHFPPGFTMESAPQQVQLPWPEHAVLVVKTQPGSGTIDIKHIFARGFVILEAKGYPALRDYYQKIATIDQQQLVLTQGN